MKKYFMIILIILSLSFISCTEKKSHDIKIYCIDKYWTSDEKIKELLKEPILETDDFMGYNKEFKMIFLKEKIKEDLTKYDHFGGTYHLGKGMFVITVDGEIALKGVTRWPMGTSFRPAGPYIEEVQEGFRIYEIYKDINEYDLTLLETAFSDMNMLKEEVFLIPAIGIDKSFDAKELYLKKEHILDYIILPDDLSVVDYKIDKEVLRYDLKGEKECFDNEYVFKGNANLIFLLKEGVDVIEFWLNDLEILRFTRDGLEVSHSATEFYDRFRGQAAQLNVMKYADEMNYSIKEYVENDLNEMMKTPKTSSNPMDYIKANEGLYHHIMYLGRDAYYYIKNELEKNDTSLRGQLLEIIYKDMIFSKEFRSNNFHFYLSDKGIEFDKISGKLTKEEIEDINTAFYTYAYKMGEKGVEEYLNPITYFFTSYYEKPEDINLFDFVYYMPRVLLEDKDEKEFEALSKTEAFPFKHLKKVSDSPVPIGRIAYGEVEDLLKKYLHINLNDVNKGTALYLEEYQSFYSYASDFAPGYFHCTEGVLKDGILTLYSKESVLTLEKKEDVYYIKSHTKR